MPSRFRVSFALTSGLSLTAATVSGAVVQVDITANFNADIIVNDSSADPIDSAQVGYAVGRNLLTRSATFSLTGDPGLASANLPDDGVFAATSSHALIELAYSNEDDGNNVWSSGGGNQSTTFVMPAAPIGDKYDVVHLLMIGLGGADPVVKLQYDTGPDNETTLTNIPDNGAGADFVLISDLDRFDGGGFTQQNQAISGYSFAVDPNRTLQSVRIEKNGQGFVSVFGLVGETSVIPEPASLVLLGCGGLLVLGRRRGRCSTHPLLALSGSLPHDSE